MNLGLLGAPRHGRLAGLRRLQDSAGIQLHPTGGRRGSVKVFSRIPLDLAEQPIPRGRAFLIPERCKGCKMCVQFCPRHVLEESPETNAKGVSHPAHRRRAGEDFVHGGFCTLVCPEFAIYSVEVEA